MRILPILSNNYNYSSKKNNLLTSNIKSDMPNNQVSFGSLGFLERIKRFNPFKVEIIETTEQAIRHLIDKDSGFYIFNGEKYIKSSLKKYSKIKEGSVNNLVLKLPNISEDEISISSEEVITKPYKYRRGISPEMVLSFLDKGVEEAILLADNGIQKLSLPKDKAIRKNAISIYEKSTELKTDERGEVIHVVPEHKSEFLYNLAKNMIKNTNVDGVNLEAVNLTPGQSYSDLIQVLLKHPAGG